MPPLDTINQVSAVGNSTDSAAQQFLAGRTRPLQPPPETTARPAPAAEKPAGGKSAANSMREVTLRYKVDPDTQAVSLLIIDRQSRKVIRAIPAEELARLGVNQIFEGLV